MMQSQNSVQVGTSAQVYTSHWFAQRYLELLSNVGSALVGGGLPVLLGFSPLPSSFPLVAFALSSPDIALGIAAGLLLLMAVGVTLALRGRRQAASGGAAIVRFVGSALLAALGSVAIGVLFGFNSLPTSIPLLELIHTHPPLGIALVTLFLALLIFAPLLGSRGARRHDENSQPGASPSADARPLLAATSVSTVTALLFVALLGTVILRPSWCPTQICPGPVTNPNGNSDGTLEITYATTENLFWQIPGEVTQYAYPHLPQTVSAVRIDSAGGDAYSQPYRAVVGVDSQQSNPSATIVIEQVIVVIDTVTPLPDPLNVWTSGPPRSYTHNPYLAVYRGEQAGGHIISYSQTQPPTATYLGEGQADELDIQVTSTLPVELRFHIEVAYNVPGGAPLRMLSLTKHEFQVAFGDASNWHVYTVGPTGRFTQ
jgi:hypothetical protein